MANCYKSPAYFGGRYRKMHKGQGANATYGCLFCFLRGMYMRAGRKMLYAQFRRWLPPDHKWRFDTERFGTVETREQPLTRTSEVVHQVGTKISIRLICVMHLLMYSMQYGFPCLHLCHFSTQKDMYTYTVNRSRSGNDRFPCNGGNWRDPPLRIRV